MFNIGTFYDGSVGVVDIGDTIILGFGDRRLDHVHGKNPRFDISVCHVRINIVVILCRGYTDFHFKNSLSVVVKTKNNAVYYRNGRSTVLDKHTQ